MKSKERIAQSLDELQHTIEEFYSNRDKNRKDSSLLLDIIISIGELSEIVRKNDTTRIPYSVSRLLTNLLRICNKKEISLNEILWYKYPGRCPYCGSMPCRCASVRKFYQIDKCDLKPFQAPSKTITLREFSELLIQIYGASSRIISIDHHVLMLYEQISEASMLLGDNSNASESALADIFVWLIMIAEKFNIDIKLIEEVMGNLHPGDQIPEKPKDSYAKLRELWNIALNSDQRAKGKTFEDFAFTFFSMVPSFRVKKNIYTDTGEFDLIIGIDPEKKGGLYWARYQPLIFVECKNRKKTTSQAVISKILGKVVAHDSGKTENLIFVLSKSYFSGEAFQQAKYAYLRGYLIAPITDNDIEKVLKIQGDIHEFLCELVENTCARVKSVVN